VLHAATALACGVCVEDRLAAVYDHRVVERALGARHHVAFWGLEGAVPGRDAKLREIVRSLDGITGVDRGTVRVSLEYGTMSFAFDPRRAPMRAVLRSAQHALAAGGLTPTLLRVIDDSTGLKPGS
jgi:hypothetical protein